MWIFFFLGSQIHSDSQSQYDCDLWGQTLKYNPGFLYIWTLEAWNFDSLSNGLLSQCPVCSILKWNLRKKSQPRDSPQPSWSFPRRIIWRLKTLSSEGCWRASIPIPFLHILPKMRNTDSLNPRKQFHPCPALCTQVAGMHRKLSPPQRPHLNRPGWRQKGYALTLICSKMVAVAWDAWFVTEMASEHILNEKLGPG